MRFWVSNIWYDQQCFLLGSNHIDSYIYIMSVHFIYIYSDISILPVGIKTVSSRKIDSDENEKKKKKQL